MEKISMYKQAWLAGAVRALSRAGFKAPVHASNLAAYGKPMSSFTVPAIGAGIGGVATPLLHEDTFYDKLTGNTGPSFGSYLKNMAIGASAGFGVQGLSKLAPVRRWAFNAKNNPALASSRAARVPEGAAMPVTRTTPEGAAMPVTRTTPEGAAMPVTRKTPEEVASLFNKPTQLTAPNAAAQKNTDALNEMLARSHAENAANQARYAKQRTSTW